MSKNFISADEIAEEMFVSKSFAYRLINQLNKDLKEMGYITVAGKVNRAYYEEKLYYKKEGRE